MDKFIDFSDIDDDDYSIDILFNTFRLLAEEVSNTLLSEDSKKKIVKLANLRSELENMLIADDIFNTTKALNEFISMIESELKKLQTLNKNGLLDDNVEQQLNKTKDLLNELQTPKANDLFNRAIKAGFVQNTESGYQWIGGPKYLLAYFSEKASKNLNLRRGKLDKNENQTISWSTFEKCFNVSNIKAGKNDWMKTPDGADGFFPPGHEEIDKLFA